MEKGWGAWEYGGGWPHLVYAATLPFSNQTYVWEAVLGLEERMRTHVRQTMMVVEKLG